MATFTGTLSGDVISGTVTYTETWSGTTPNDLTNPIAGGGTVSFAVTLTKK